MTDDNTITTEAETDANADADAIADALSFFNYAFFQANNSELYSLPNNDNLVLDYIINHPENVTYPQRRPDEVVSTIDFRSEIDLLVCHVVALLPFHHHHDDNKGTRDPIRITYEDAAAIALALQHLNVANGTVVPEVERIAGDCNVLFTIEYLGTYLDPGRSIDEVFEIVGRGGSSSEDNNNNSDNTGYRTRPCSFIGAVRSATTVPTALLTSQRGFVQVSGAATSSELNDPSQFRLFGRSLPSDQYNVIPLIEYLRRLNIQHVALLTLNEAYGNSFGQYFNVELNKNNSTTEQQLHVQRIILTSDVSEIAIRDGLQTLKDSEYRYVIAVLYDFQGYDRVMAQAYTMGLAGNGEYQWYFPNSFQTTMSDHIFPVDSPLAHAYRGIGFFGEGVPSNNKSEKDRYKKFAASMKDMKNGPDLSYLDIVIPEPPNSTKLSHLPAKGKHSNRTKIPEIYLDRFNATVHAFLDDSTTQPLLYEDTFLNPIKHDAAAFFYDATIMMGLGACQAAQMNGGSAFTGQEQFDRMTELAFQGVTGDVIIDPNTGSRLFNTTKYKMENFVRHENGTHVTFKRVLTDIYQEGQWENVSQFIYGDGSTDAPLDLPFVDVNRNYISSTMRGIAWVFCAVSILTAIGFAAWTFRNRKTRVVKASQPFFLYVICFGVVVLASKIIPASLDANTSSRSTLQATCNSVVWLFALGVSIILSALWAKTYRINRIMQSAKKFRRVKVTIVDTLKPMGVLLAANIIVLTIMHSLAPVEWYIMVSRYDRFDREVNVQGQCHYADKPQIWYLITLAVLNVATLLMSIWQSWRARRLSTEYAESRSVFQALLLIAVTSFVALPVLVLADATPSIVLFLNSALTLVICESLLLLIFFPKVTFARDEKRRSKHVQISGLSPVERPNNSDHRTGGASALNATFDLSSADEEKDDNESDDDCGGECGERIVTTKTAKNLATEVRLLQAKVRRLEHQIDRQHQNEHHDVEHENLLTVNSE